MINSGRLVEALPLSVMGGSAWLITSEPGYCVFKRRRAAASAVYYLFIVLVDGLSITTSAMISAALVGTITLVGSSFASSAFLIKATYSSLVMST